MKQYRGRVCMRRISAPGGVYRDLPDFMPKYESSKYRNAKVLKELNVSREGTMLDFIDAFCERFPKILIRWNLVDR